MTKCTPLNLKSGELLPTETGNYNYIELNPNEIYECEQPDILDDSEFNLLVKMNDDGKVFVMRSIDFDFLP